MTRGERLWLAGYATLVVLLWAATAIAHSWYDPECCGPNDCKPIPCEDIKEGAPGYYKYYEYGQIAKKQARPSRDDACHICLTSVGFIRCLYISKAPIS